MILMNEPGRSPLPAEAKAAAWNRFYDYCFRIVHSCPGVRRLSTTDREDCVQEVMLEIVRKFGGELPEDAQKNVGGWVNVVARNKAADIARRRTRKPEKGFEDGSGGGIPADAASSDAAAPLEVGESISLVWEALLELDHEVTVTSYLAFFIRTDRGMVGTRCGGDARHVFRAGSYSDLPRQVALRRPDGRERSVRSTQRHPV